MKQMTVFKNKGAVFNCHFQVEGTNLDDVQVRLCLEFDNNTNLFFNGQLSKDGECTFQIPKLPELSSPTGKLTVEAIAENTYFKVYECDVNFKNSVEVKLTNTSHHQDSQAKVELAEIKISDDTTQKIVIESDEESKPEANPFIPKNPPKPQKESKNFLNYLKQK